MLIGLVGVSQAQVNTVYGQNAGANEQNSNADISAFGYNALYPCTYCFGSSAFGFQALLDANGNYNTAVGYNAAYNPSTGGQNTAIGAFTMYYLTSGINNVAIGYNSGSCAAGSGSNNIWISHCGLAKDVGVIRIGTQGVQRFTQIAGIYGVKCAPPCYEVVVNAKGQLGYSTTLVQAPASQTDVMSLRTELAAAKNMIYALQRDVAMLKAARIH